MPTSILRLPFGQCFGGQVGDPIDPSDAKARLFVARYLKKCPISNQRLSLTTSNGDTLMGTVENLDLPLNESLNRVEQTHDVARGIKSVFSKDFLEGRAAEKLIRTLLASGRFVNRPKGLKTAY